MFEKINKNLIELYTSFEDNGIKNISDKYEGNLDGPILLQCWEEYGKASYKILFIGQEPNKWVGEAMNEINRPLLKYKEFGLAKERKDNTTFWKAVKLINKLLNPTLEGTNCFLWTNVSKYSTWDGKSLSKDDHKFIVSELNLLPKELEIIKPDIVIFFSGPAYDDKIRVQFDDTLSFDQLQNDIPLNELAKVKHRLLPEMTFRTYHPGYLQRPPKKWNYLNLIHMNILGYDLNLIVNTFIGQIKNIASEFELEYMIISKPFTISESGFYFWKKNWEYCGIGFEFESNGYGDFFYGIRRKDKAVEIPEGIKFILNERLIDKDGQNTIWPWWKWFEQRNWNVNVINEIKDGQFILKIKEIVETLIMELQGVDL